MANECVKTAKKKVSLTENFNNLITEILSLQTG